MSEWTGGRVAVISGMGGVTRRYRADYKAEQLALAGVDADVLPHDEVDYDAVVDRYDVFVLHRLGWRQALPQFLRRARESRKPMLYESDDYLFDREAADLVAIAKHRSDEERREKMERQARTLRACDGATLSTEPLADLARRLNPNVAVLPNAVGDELVRLADEALRRPRANEAVTIGYVSGTATHDRDFLEAADAVLAALERFPETRFLVVGKLELDGRFDRLGDRVERIPYQPYDRVFELTTGIDVNLAPLEPDNPFTASKSCLKWLEAGLVRVPTVASAEPDFVRVVRDGENGFLARSRDDWHEALFRLVADEELRRRVGAAAFDEIRAKHTTRARASEHAVALAELIERVRPGRAAAAGVRLARLVRPLVKKP